MDCGQMGACRKGPEAGIQILPAHRYRQETAHGGRIEMEEADTGGCANHVACQGRLICVGAGIENASRSWSAKFAPTSRWKRRSERPMVFRRKMRATPPGGPLAT